MAKEISNKHNAQPESEYIHSHVQPKVRSKIVPKVVSRIQPKLMLNIKPKHDPLEQEADEMGKRASEGQRVEVRGKTEGEIQKKEIDTKIIDKGETKHAHGKFDSTANSYTVPDTSVYEDPEQAFDTLYSISVRFGVTIEAIKKVNNLESDAVVPWQILIIPSDTLTKQEPKLIKQEVKQIVLSKPKPIMPVKQKSAAEIIGKHTNYLMLNEEALAQELVKDYLFSRPEMVLEVLKHLHEWNEDDVSCAILNLVPLAHWDRIDRKVLKNIYNSINSGIVEEDEKMRITQLDKILNPQIETIQKQKTINLPEIKKQQVAPKIDSTVNKEAVQEIKRNSDPGNKGLFSIDKSKDQAIYLQQMYDNKNEGKWQKDDLDIDETLPEVEQRVEIAKQIEKKDQRTYQALTMSQGRLTDNYVDCAEFVSEVLWIQGYQTLPSGDCLAQLNWFKSNGTWGESFDEIKVGDLIFWDNKMDGLGEEDSDYNYKGNLDHVGIVTEKLQNGSVKFIHASVNKDPKTHKKRDSINNLYNTDANGHNFLLTKNEQRFVAWARIKK